jgi:hydroxymethylpyrimidine pyrophosphatase-like HAD family hydrolase
LVQKIFFEFLQVDEIPVSDFEEATRGDIFQMTPFITVEKEKEIRPRIPDCEIERWHPTFADITAKGNTKQKGMDEIIRYFELLREETMAFGDGGNDVSMLCHAAIGVAMGQASDEVKQFADYVTNSVDDNGIRNALKYFGII